MAGMVALRVVLLLPVVLGMKLDGYNSEQAWLAQQQETYRFINEQAARMKLDGYISDQAWLAQQQENYRLINEQAEHAVPAKVKLELDYETLCPYCEDLITNGLREVVEDEEFMSRLDLEMRPFGNAQVVPGSKISEGYHYFHPDAIYPVIMCQHKEQECLGNAIQACALNMTTLPQALDLILCMANGHSGGHGLEMSAYDCMKENDMNLDGLATCAQGQLGHDLLVEIGEKASRPELNRSYVPWVTFGNEHLELGDDHALVQALCSKMESPLPSKCSTTKVQAPNLLAFGGDVTFEAHVKKAPTKVCPMDAAMPA
jgi:interferon gamma-inducible protein 30